MYSSPFRLKAFLRSLWRRYQTQVWVTAMLLILAVMIAGVFY